VKDVAVSSSWLGLIQKEAKKKYKFAEGTFEKDGIAFNERLVLLLVLPIRYSNLKSSDVANVSNGVCLYSYIVLSVLVFYVLMILSTTGNPNISNSRSFP
jgi:hypothetical protein